jgi:hypothetical protein
MPRRRKPPPGAGNQGGYGAQPAEAPTGLPYGEHQASVQSQQALPMAQVSGPSVEAPATPAQDPAQRLQAAVDAARRMRPPAPLTGPSKRPGEPITAGMASGPGPGPEVLRTGDRVARTFRLLSEITGDQAFADLYEQALLRGR